MTGKPEAILLQLALAVVRPHDSRRDAGATFLRSLSFAISGASNVLGLEDKFGLVFSLKDFFDQHFTR